MRMRFRLGFVEMAASGGSPPVDYEAEVEAILSGTSGYAIDPTDLSKMWQDFAKTTPVTTAGQTLAYIDGQFGSSASALANSTVAQQPTWGGNSDIVFDATDDLFDKVSGWAAMSGAAALSVATRVRLTALNKRIYFLSTSNVNTVRFSATAATTGALSVVVRKDDAIAGNTYTSAAGVLSTGVEHTILIECDNAGANTLKAWVDGVEVINTTMSDGAANFSATTSARVRFGEARPFELGRIVMEPGLWSAGERSYIESWLAEVGL